MEWDVPPRGSEFVSAQPQLLLLGLSLNGHGKQPLVKRDKLMYVCRSHTPLQSVRIHWWGQPPQCFLLTFFLTGQGITLSEQEVPLAFCCCSRSNLRPSPERSLRANASPFQDLIRFYNLLEGSIFEVSHVCPSLFPRVKVPQSTSCPQARLGKELELVLTDPHLV